METNITFYDHALILLVALAYPLAGYFSFKRLLRRLAAGETANRQHLYRNTCAGHWSLFVLFVLLWAGTSRDWSAVGFTVAVDQWTAVGALLTLVAIVVLFLQLRQVQNAPQKTIDDYSRRIGKLSIIVPRNGAELAGFYGVAVTAGIVEEVLWRGFIIWYLNQFMPLWAAALISTIGFAAAHAYQGVSNMPQLFAVSAVLAALYLLSGSILLPMILHAAVDILQGRLGYDVMFRSTLGDKASGLSSA